MFWTQNLKPLTICFALGIVHIAEEPGCSVEQKKTLLVKASELNKIVINVQIISVTYPSILVGYMDPKEV